MPFVRITVRAGTRLETQRGIADGVHRAMVAALGIPDGDRFQIVDERPSQCLIFDRGYLGVDREDVVFIEITLARGRSAELKEALYAAIADNLAVPRVGVRRQDVFVTLHEVGREDFSFGDGAAQLLDEALMRRHGWNPPGD